MTKYLADIFEILRRGQFICDNSPDQEIQTFYNIMEDKDTFDDLHAYFKQINYILEQGNGYFYFSREEKNADIDRKLDKAFEWIDWLDFLKSYDNTFDVGFRFTPAEIASQLKNNADLKNKLENLKNIRGNKRSHDERIRKIIDKLEKENFIALEEEISETYKVLNSFHYLKDLVSIINIPEEIENEIPE